ncbi:MAG: DUF192 domain-containing protein [Chloroflexota bacterium]|nr:DUF192 domain-containing protein [Chloroflexota bacterium]
MIAGRVWVARSFAARWRGLMGRAALEHDEGLYLPGSNGVHMLFMRFPIDCVFVDRPAADGSQRVVALRRALPPWRGVVWYVRGAHGAFELPAGTIDRSGLAVGDVVRLEQRTAA